VAPKVKLCDTEYLTISLHNVNYVLTPRKLFRADGRYACPSIYIMLQPCYALTQAPTAKNSTALHSPFKRIMVKLELCYKSLFMCHPTRRNVVAVIDNITAYLYNQACISFASPVQITRNVYKKYEQSVLSINMTWTSGVKLEAIKRLYILIIIFHL